MDSVTLGEIVGLSRRSLRHCSDCRIDCRSGCRSRLSPSRSACLQTLLQLVAGELQQQLEQTDYYEHKDIKQSSMVGTVGDCCVWGLQVLRRCYINIQIHVPTRVGRGGTFSAL